MGGRSDNFFFEELISLFLSLHYKGEEGYRISQENVDDLIAFLQTLLRRAGLAQAEEADGRSSTAC
jgi:hypothetical protein